MIEMAITVIETANSFDDGEEEEKPEKRKREI